MSDSERHFLVVEDDPQVREAVGQGAQGVLAARFAETGDEACTALRGDSRPEFVLLDYRLPGMQGIEVLRWLRADPRLEDLPVLMFSSLSDPARIQATLDAGADAWIPKPNDPTGLQDLVRSLCLGWEATRPAPADATDALADLPVPVILAGRRPRGTGPGPRAGA